MKKKFSQEKADSKDLKMGDFCNTVRDNEVIRTKIIGFNPDEKYDCLCKFGSLVSAISSVFIALYMFLI